MQRNAGLWRFEAMLPCSWALAWSYCIATAGKLANFMMPQGRRVRDCPSHDAELNYARPSMRTTRVC